MHELEVYGVETLNEVIDFLNGTNELTPTEFNIEAEFEKKLEDLSVDFSDVKGQLNIKRSFEIAAAGGHNVMKMGNTKTVSK